MHDPLTREDVQRLMEYKSENAVSLYMPANRVTTEVQKDTLRLKNLVAKAQEELMARGMRRPTALELLQPAANLLEDADFWRNQSHGLAIFLAPDREPEFYRLPVRFTEFWQVSYRFYVKPLLRLFSHDGHYFVLALSRNSVRFLRGNQYGLEEETVEDLPEDIVDALGEWDPERELQWHTGSGRTSGDGRQGAMFHGHAGSDVDIKDEMLRYFRRIDDALHPILREERAPLVLAAVDYLHPIFEEVSRYDHLLEKGVDGNVEEFSEQELHTETWKLVEPVFEERRKEDQGNFSQLAGTGRTSHYVDELAVAAFQGRIETAFVPHGTRVWGKFDAETGEVVAQADPVYLGTGGAVTRGDGESRPNNQGQNSGQNIEDISEQNNEATREDKEDLLDFIALHTYLNGGAVHVLEPEQIPGNEVAAAIYRF